MIRPMLLAGLIALLLVFGAFLRFVTLLPRAVSDPARQTDALIVLTGGPDRVREGIDLMHRGLARRMFISGVGANVSRVSLLNSLQTGSDPEGRLANLFACCVDLGLTAENTAGNAIETATWIEAQGHRSIRLVTAFWHIPRSMVEFRRRLPDTEIIAHPVFSANVSTEQFLERPRTVMLLAVEFSKYVFARLRALGGKWLYDQDADVADARKGTS